MKTAAAKTKGRAGLRLTTKQGRLRAQSRPSTQMPKRHFCLAKPLAETYLALKK
jgi:hypothetical protein